MATFWPTSRFMSVDFPALGRPTIATNPDLCPLFGPLFSVFSVSSAVSMKCFLLGIPLFYHWQLQHARMFRVMDQGDVRRLRVFRGFESYHSSAVVVLLGAGRIRAMHEQSQAASLRDAPREKCE